MNKHRATSTPKFKGNLLVIQLWIIYVIIFPYSAKKSKKEKPGKNKAVIDSPTTKSHTISKPTSAEVSVRICQPCITRGGIFVW